MKNQVMRRKLLRELRGAKAGRGGAIRALGGAIVDNLRLLSPRDTNRYVRGWLHAGREAGVFGGPIPRLNESKWHKSNLEQAEIWLQRAEQNHGNAAKRLRDTFPSGAPKRGQAKLYGRLSREVDKANGRLNEARLTVGELRTDKYAIVFGAGRVVGRGAKQKRLGVGRITLRQKIYGGSGWILDRGTSSTIRLLNHEPHALILESKKGVLRQATAAARGAGLLPYKRVYLNAVRKAV